MADVGTLDVDTDADELKTTGEKEAEIAKRGLAVGLGMKRQQLPLVHDFVDARPTASCTGLCTLAPNNFASSA